MPFIAAEQARPFEVHGTHFTALSAPSRGSVENSVWIVSVGANTPGVPHRVTREETFVGLEGQALAEVDGVTYRLTVGSALVVPAQSMLKLANPYAEPFRAVTVLPVGGQAVMQGGEPFTPPWAA